NSLSRAPVRARLLVDRILRPPRYPRCPCQSRRCAHRADRRRRPPHPSDNAGRGLPVSGSISGVPDYSTPPGAMRPGALVIRLSRYGRQRVARPLKLMAGGEPQVSPANAPVSTNVFGNLVEKLPSFGIPVDPNPPAATVVIVSGFGVKFRQIPV